MILRNGSLGAVSRGTQRSKVTIAEQMPPLG